MKRSKILIRFVMMSLVSFLCALSASAYEGTGFTIDIPEDWLNVAEGNGLYHWLTPEEDAELVVAVSDNENQRNPFDVQEEEIEEVLSEWNMASEFVRNMEEGFLRQGISCTVEEEAVTFSLCEWSDGQPALIVEGQYYIYLTEAEIETPYYLYMAILTAKEHSFAISCSSTDEAAMKAVMENEVLNTFRMTEPVYDGPTETGSALGDVVFSVGVTLLCAAVAVSGALGLLQARKKKAVDIAEHL